jgi:hypothetical protein
LAKVLQQSVIDLRDHHPRQQRQGARRHEHGHRLKQLTTTHQHNERRRRDAKINAMVVTEERRHADHQTEQ